MKSFLTSFLSSLVLAGLALGQPVSGPSVLSPGGEPHGPSSVAHLIGAAEIRKQLGLQPAYGAVQGLENVKVAVLDYGFDGIDGVRPYLPAGTVLVENYDPDLVNRFHLGSPEFKKPFEPGNAHGRTMAQIIWGVTGFHAGGPRFYLLNANGPTMLRRAIRHAIQEKIDIILFSGNFEGGGNGDGRGPIDAAVDEALAAGIIWINAAGNYGGRVYHGPIQPTSTGYLRLGRGENGTALRFRNLFDENTVTITLTWNDYRQEEDAGTDKDLDLYVEDGRGRVLGSSTLQQVSGTSEAGPGESRNPRERIVLTDLAASGDRPYLIRVKARSGHFTSADRLRVVLTASRDTPFPDPKTGMPTEPVQFLDASESEEIYPPADHPGVIAVGDTSRSSALGPTADGRIKPDVILSRSIAQFSNGEETTGSSNAAAYFAGIVAVLKAAQPTLSSRHLLALARRNDGHSETSHPGDDRKRLPKSPSGKLTGARRPAVQAQQVQHLQISSSGKVPSPGPVGKRLPPRRLWRTPGPQELADLFR